LKGTTNVFIRQDAVEYTLVDSYFGIKNRFEISKKRLKKLFKGINIYSNAVLTFLLTTILLT
jgi:hypothetical protein